MFKIGDFSKLTRVSVRMLRHYDRMGLLKPAHVDPLNGYRYYAAAQITRLGRIVALRDMGFNVAEIDRGLREESAQAFRAMLREHRERIAQNVRREQSRLARIDRTLERIEKENEQMDFAVEIKSVSSFAAVSLRDTIPSYDAEGMLWQRLGAFIEEKGLTCTGATYATYHDEGYREADVDVEVVAGVRERLADEREFVFSDTPPIPKAASVLVPGDFSNIAPAFAFLARWIEENGYELCGNPRELPLRGPWNESDPENYLNEIQIPVRKAAPQS